MVATLIWLNTSAGISAIFTAITAKSLSASVPLICASTAVPASKSVLFSSVAAVSSKLFSPVEAAVPS